MRKRERIQTHNEGESMTHQSFKETSDINYLLKRHGVGAVARQPDPNDFMDVAHTMDYFEMRSTLAAEATKFAELPSDVRFAFGNDVANLMSAFEAAGDDNEDAIALLRETGFMKPPPMQATEEDTDDRQQVSLPNNDDE